MIEIRIRREWSAKAVHLCDAMLDDLDEVLSTVKAWGIADADGDDLFGQIVVTESAAYFEIVVVEGES